MISDRTTSLKGGIGVHLLQPNNSNSDQFIGKFTACDIVNESGQMLVASFTMLTAEHIQLFEREDVAVTMDSVLPYGPFINMSTHVYEPVIEEAVARVSIIYDDIKRTREIPLSKIRQKIVPVIHHITKQPPCFELLALLQTKDDYLDRHTFAVAVIATMLGRWLNLNESELLQLTTAALLHNVGNTQLPQFLFAKRDIFSEDDHALIKRHVTIGYEMIKQTIGTNYKQSLVALQHHERNDGLGYPLGISGVRTELFSQIVAVADVFHAISSKRTYSDPKSFHELLVEMEEDAYGKLDPQLVQLFIDKLMHYAIGYDALLTNGQIGRIIRINPLDLKRPLLKIGEQFIDLTMNTDVCIEKIVILAE